MHSLFSRKQSSSTNLAAAAAAAPRSGHFDEFGALSDRESPRTSRTTSSRDKDDRKTARKRTTSSPSRAGISSADLHSSGGGPAAEFAHLPDGSFLPTVIPLKPTPPSQLGKSTLDVQEYGYISADADVILSLDDVLRLVNVVDRELSTRGTPHDYVIP